MQQFILLFVSVLFLSAIWNNGFFAITRGRWVINQDDSRTWTGKIFSFWHKFLQQHKTELRPYQNHEWFKKYFELRTFFKDGEIVTIFTNAMGVKRMDDIKLKNFKAFALSKGLETDIIDNPDNSATYLIAAYKEVKIYKFPYWFRDPLGECITCMASLFGTACWIFWYYAAVNVQAYYPTPAVHALIEMPLIGKIGLWVFFCISLAYLNELFANINDKLKK